MRSPISEKVDLGNFVSDSLVDVGNEVPDDGGPQVTDVERLGNVGRTGKQETMEILKMKKDYMQRKRKKKETQIERKRRTKKFLPPSPPETYSRAITRLKGRREIERR